MKTRLLSGLVGLFFGLVALPLGEPSGEATYRGRSYSHWRARVKEWVEYDDACWWWGDFNALHVHEHEPPSWDNIRRLREGQWHPVEPLPDWGKPADRARLPLLIHLIQDENRLVRHYAAMRLSMRDSIAAPAIPALIRALRTEDVCMRVLVASSLAVMGRTATPAVPALLGLLKDTRRGHERVVARANIAEALEYIDPEALNMLGKLPQTRLRDEDFEEFEKSIGIR